MYRGVCLECGFEKIAAYSDFKKNVMTCRHGLVSDNKICECCGQAIPLGNAKASEYRKRKYCSSSCAAKINNPTRVKSHKKIEVVDNDSVGLKDISSTQERVCLHCGSMLTRSQMMFC